MLSAPGRKTKLVLLAGILCSVSGCEAWIGPRAMREHPPRGQLVSAGSHRLQMDCRGSGSPVVVLEGGGDMYGSLAWTAVQDRLAAGTRVCAYSRAGIMWSETRPAPLQAEGVPRELRAALESAGERPPFVLVGASRGGVYSLIFTDLFRDEVSGLVLVESSHPEQVERYAAAGMTLEDTLPAHVSLGRTLRWTGLPRVVSSRFTAASMPADVNAAYRAYFPHSLDGYVSEKNALAGVRARARQIRDLRDLPLIVLTRQLPPSARPTEEGARERFDAWEALWRSLHAEMSAWSTHGELRVVPDSDHGMHMSRPEAVVRAVEDVIAKVKTIAPAGG